MRESILNTGGSPQKRWQYRIGLRFLLVMVFFAALILGWVTREYRQAERRTALVAELSTIGVLTILDEPTGLALLVKKFFPKYEQPLRERIGIGWFQRPTVFVCTKLEDEQVPFAVKQLKALGTVRAVHTQGPHLTQRGVSDLQDGLPGVEIVPAANPALHRYFRDQVSHEHFATEGLQLAGLLVLGLFGTAVFFAWPLMRRRRQRASAAYAGEVSVGGANRIAARGAIGREGFDSFGSLISGRGAPDSTRRIPV